MAYQHTTPHQSIAAAHAAEQRAKAGQTSRMKMDACYQLYEAALQCKSTFMAPESLPTPHLLCMAAGRCMVVMLCHEPRCLITDDVEQQHRHDLQ